MNFLGRGRGWAAFFCVSLLRFICVVPFVIDDDEAWWSASGASLHWPWETYRAAVDDKPPGMNSFYWVLEKLLPHGSDPRLARAVYTILTILGALLLGWMVQKFRKAKGIDGWGATAFLLASAAAGPKLLAVTADGLMALLATAAFALLLFFEGAAAALTAGAIMGGAFLVKQTAVFFVVPILFASAANGNGNGKKGISALRISPRKQGLAALGAAAILVPAVLLMGFHDFWFWNWTYPSRVLPGVRKKIFDTGTELFWSVAILGVATLPLWLRVVPAILKFRTRFESFRIRDFRVLWLLSGLGAALFARGVFIHYFLLCIPALVLLFREGASPEDGDAKALVWLAVPYTLGCLFLLIPASGIFWGSDLIYFESLNQAVQRSLQSDDQILVWGGTPVPLAYSRQPHSTRFIVPRFAVEPYSTPETRETFHRELEGRPPDVVLDLHERGENRFDNPIESEPVLAAILKRDHYSLYLEPSLPWAKFYFRAKPREGSGLLEVANGDGDDGARKAAYSPFPKAKETWLQLLEAMKKNGLGLGELLHAFLQKDRELRTDAALELLERQGPSAAFRSRAKDLRKRLTAFPGDPVALDEAFVFASQEGRALPLRSLAWWPELALVELQPRAGDFIPRGKSGEQ